MARVKCRLDSGATNFFSIAYRIRKGSNGSEMRIPPLPDRAACRSFREICRCPEADTTATQAGARGAHDRKMPASISCGRYYPRQGDTVGRHSSNPANRMCPIQPSRFSGRYSSSPPCDRNFMSWGLGLVVGVVTAVALPCADPFRTRSTRRSRRGKVGKGQQREGLRRSRARETQRWER
jgi:hypothetical protein